MLKRSFPDISRENASKIFTDADVDGDGVITYDEFKRLAAKEGNEAYTQVFTNTFHEHAAKLVDTADKKEAALRQRKTAAKSTAGTDTSGGRSGGGRRAD